MTQNNYINDLLSQTLNQALNQAVNQAILNQKFSKAQLPEDQQEALNKMLDAIHDFREGQKKIQPEYVAQARDSVLLKFASEYGIPTGGNIK